MMLRSDRRRNQSLLKNILRDSGGRLAAPKSVIWAFTNEEGRWRAKFPGSFSDEDRAQTAKLIEVFKNLDDVQDVYHNLN